MNTEQCERGLIVEERGSDIPNEIKYKGYANKDTVFACVRRLEIFLEHVWCGGEAFYQATDSCESRT